MKKNITVVLLVVLIAGFALSEKIRIGATPVPHAEILEFIKLELEKEGFELEVVVFNDYVLPNMALANGELDANYFQHVPYLEVFTTERGIEGLVPQPPIHVEPMGFYAKKGLNKLEKNDKVVVPNDPTNEGRALLLLHNNGIIKLKDPENLEATVIDIAENPKSLKFSEVEAGFIPRVYNTDDSVDAAVINTNYAISAGLNPIEDAKFYEGEDSAYANIVVVREEDTNSEWLDVLQSALRSEAVKEFILNKYEGAVVPTF